ncbi:MAG: YdcF family protein [Deltaproteobacteria bacterium]|nr:YdcF family protein [Deltaproteobacteria bacterium]
MIGLIARALEAPLVIKEPFQPLDAIVVLGAPLGPSNSLSAPLAERVHAAAELYRRGGAPLVVTTGGITRGASRAEADVLADALRAAGVPDVLVERASLTTADNARLTAELLAERDARRVWLVTQPFHGRRAARVFRAAGFEAHVWHIHDSLEYAERARAVKWLVREYAAWAKLLVRGR